MPFDDTTARELVPSPDLSTGVGRLRHLLWFFETHVSPDHVNLGLWGSDCGTVACLGGWAATIPEFVDLGLSASGNGAPVYKGREEQAALALFFDLDILDALLLFNNSHEDVRRHREVAVRRLREVIDQESG